MILIEDKNYYPTPEHLIKKMFNDCDKSQIKTILEPSAGKGNIADFISKEFRYDRFDLDCIEINPVLQATLKGKEFRVVHDDFLTYRTQKNYDLIVMNPPFDCGDKHLLKALELQQNGGAIICLLNAETLRNPYTNTRKDLSHRLEELNANIEYIEGAFTDAERGTGVEVALIKVFIPEKEFESDIFENMQKAMEFDEVEVTEEQQYALVSADFMEMLKAAIHQYNVEINAGVKLIREYHAMKPIILNELKKPEDRHDYRKPILELKVDNDRYGIVNGYVKAVRLKYWKFLFHNEIFMGRLTTNLRNDYYNKINRMEDYEFSIYNILTIKEDMQKNIVKGVEDTILSLFDELSHKHHWNDETSKNVHYYSGWKTNKAHKINKKVIIPFYMFRSYGGYNTWDACTKMQDMTKVFDYLDCGQTQYHYDIRREVEDSISREQTRNIELKYFWVTFYKKNTCHIEFKNEKLLEKFNLFGSQRKGWLPPCYGKKAYTDMDSEEKTVVQEFSGNENNYNEIYANQDYYIVNEQLLIGNL
jgi:hypothetical protein